MIHSEFNTDTNQSSNVTSASKGGLKSIGEVIRGNAAAKPETMAIVSSVYQPLSYRQLVTQFDDFAAALYGAGLGRQSRVAIGLKDAPQAALAIVSVCCTAVAVPLDPNLTAVEIETRLKLLDADAVILLDSDNSPLRDAVERLKIPVLEAAATAERRLDLRLGVPKEVCSAAPNDDREPECPAFILQTSGTTAEPKLVPYSHRNMLATAARVRGWFNLDNHDRCLSVSPVYYCHGLTLTVLAPLLSGGTVAFPVSPSRTRSDRVVFLAAALLDVGEVLQPIALYSRRSNRSRAEPSNTSFALLYLVVLCFTPRSKLGFNRRWECPCWSTTARQKLGKSQPIFRRQGQPRWAPVGCRTPTR